MSNSNYDPLFGNAVGAMLEMVRRGYSVEVSPFDDSVAVCACKDGKRYSYITDGLKGAELERSLRHMPCVIGGEVLCRTEVAAQHGSKPDLDMAPRTYKDFELGRSET